MDWLCPAYTKLLGQKLSEYHGKLDGPMTAREVVPIVQTGDLHIAITDFKANAVYLANARSSKRPKTEPLKAYDRTFTKLDLAAAWAVKQE